MNTWPLLAALWKAGTRILKQRIQSGLANPESGSRFAAQELVQMGRARAMNKVSLTIPVTLHRPFNLCCPDLPHLPEGWTTFVLPAPKEVSMLKGSDC